MTNAPAAPSVESIARALHDLGDLPWSVAGFQPHVWRRDHSLEIGASPRAEIPAVPASVPGSVQAALRDAGILPDWNHGLASRHCEWVENRHWVYETHVPADRLGRSGDRVRLRCLGLDGNGSIFVNDTEVAAFDNAHVPVVVDISRLRRDGPNRLRIVFECPPRWLGQFGHSSRMTAPKPRFNYHWDWTSRLVQIGPWDRVLVEVTPVGELGPLHVSSGFDPDAGIGSLTVAGDPVAPRDGRILAVLADGETVLHRERITPAEFRRNGIRWDALDVAPWWPTGAGEPALYRLRIELHDADRHQLDAVEFRVGFRRIEWRPCEGAPPDADPWICAVNDRPLFLQGVNWTPVRPDFAGVAPDEIVARLRLYRDIGCNLLRVWGGAVLESETFYDACDELGLLVWQEFPLSSSGVENLPPSDPDGIERFGGIARSFVRRRRHHPCLALWCGGNELHDDDGPCDTRHPMLARFAAVVRDLDPGRRFLPTSPSGPAFGADPAAFGSGRHWDVHGPWKADGDLADGWSRYWAGDDALFRAETGAPGPSPVDIIRRFAGDLDPMPVSLDNPLWRRSPWWCEADEFARAHGRPPEDLDEYVRWGQERQAEALRIAARACRDRFPRCGGFLVWMGHDSFPCAANTAIIDFLGRPKPAAYALAEVFGGRLASSSGAQHA